jgi:hypothetical protein
MPVDARSVLEQLLYALDIAVINHTEQITVAVLVHSCSTVTQFKTNVTNDRTWSLYS